MVLSKSNKTGGIILPDFNILYKGVIIKTLIDIGQWDRIENLEINPVFMTRWLLTKVSRHTVGKGYFFNK